MIFQWSKDSLKLNHAGNVYLSFSSVFKAKTQPIIPRWLHLDDIFQHTYSRGWIGCNGCWRLAKSQFSTKAA